MNRARVVGISILSLIGVTLISLALFPSLTASPTPEQPRRLSIQEVTISPTTVTGATATLQVTTHLVHQNTNSDNITVVVRAVHRDSGFVAATTRTSVGTVTADREVTVTQNVSVDRQGGYRLTAIVYRDGERVTETTKVVTGVDSLTPTYARSAVEFHWQPGDALPPVEYTIADARHNRTTLNVSTFLTNTGTNASDSLRVVFVARQVDSQIIADRAAVTVAGIQPGHTATPSVALNVAPGYNYYLDAILWRDGVIIGTARSVATLNPSETVPENATVRDVELAVTDFTSPTPTPQSNADQNPRSDPQHSPTSGTDGGAAATPGFTGALAVIAVGAALLGIRRYTYE